MSDLIKKLHDKSTVISWPERYEIADELERLEADNDKWHRSNTHFAIENERLNVRVAELEGALRDATDAIKTLPPDIFGDVITDEMKWPIRDELIHKCRKALKD